jgi:hypothetical protein
MISQERWTELRRASRPGSYQVTSCRLMGATPSDRRINLKAQSQFRTEGQIENSEVNQTVAVQLTIECEDARVGV